VKKYFLLLTLYGTSFASDYSIFDISPRSEYKLNISTHDRLEINNYQSLSPIEKLLYIHNKEQKLQMNIEFNLDEKNKKKRKSKLENLNIIKFFKDLHTPINRNNRIKFRGTELLYKKSF
jgi:hypothetical protein